MKHSNAQFLRGTACALLAMGVLAVGGRSMPAEDFIPTAVSPASPGAIQAIQQAKDPSSAVQAFVEGIAHNGNNVSLYQAYVNKMVSFGLPGMAYSQAQYAVDVDSRFGLGWAVLAYGDSRQDQMTTAFSEIVQADRYANNDPFVQATAGQLLAWYDNASDKPAIDATLQGDLARMRTNMMDLPAFKQAYQAADKNYKNLATEGASSSAVPPSGTGYEQTPAGQTYYSEGPAAAYAPEYYSPDFYAESFPYSWWQPVFWPSPGFLFFGSHHHHFFIGDGDFDRDDWGHHGQVWTHNGRALLSSQRALLSPPNSVIVPAQGIAANRLTRSSGIAAVSGTTGVVSVSPQTTAVTGNPLLTTAATAARRSTGIAGTTGTTAARVPAMTPNQLTASQALTRQPTTVSPRNWTSNSLPPLRETPRTVAPSNRTLSMEGPSANTALPSRFNWMERPKSSFHAATPVAPQPFVPSGPAYGFGSSDTRSPSATFGLSNQTFPSEYATGGHATSGHATGGQATGGHATGGHATGSNGGGRGR